MIGALPVGLKGKLYGQPFKVLVQYDAFGGVRAQIYADDTEGGMITEISGRSGEVDTKSEAFAQWAILRAIKSGDIKEGKAKLKLVTNAYRKNQEVIEVLDKEENVVKDIKRRAKLFIKDLHKEVKDFNSGKDTKTTRPKEKVMLAPKKTKAPAKAKKKINFRTIDVKGYCVEPHKRKIKIMIGGL